MALLQSHFVSLCPNNCLVRLPAQQVQVRIHRRLGGEIMLFPVRQFHDIQFIDFHSLALSGLGGFPSFYGLIITQNTQSVNTLLKKFPTPLGSSADPIGAIVCGIGISQPNLPHNPHLPPV